MSKLPRYYMISDRKLCKQKNISKEVQLIQLRDKELSTEPLFELAIKSKALCDKKKIKLLINSRVDIALALDLDGVHFPQSNTCLSISEARILLGKKKLIGKSTHTLKEALHAQKEGADFITFGPIFETPSKIKLGKPVGLKKLKHVCTKVKIPVYALGGLNQEDLSKVQEQGAYGLAGIRTFL